MSPHELRPSERRFDLGVLLLAAFFLSGATALVFEVIWTRELLLAMGATSTAVGTVLGAFMAGMALGSAVAGSSLLSRASPVRTYALLEGGIGLYALASPHLLRVVSTLPAPAQLIAAFSLLLPATVAMGASLPLLSRALARTSTRPGVTVGQLYAVNTGGAVAGPLIAVFFLFPSVGLTRTLFVAAAVNVLLCASLLIARRALSFLEEVDPGEKHDGAGEAFERPAILLLLALAVSGATAMIYEVAWSRTLAMVFGSSVYGVSIMLSTFLLGLTAGSFLAALWLRARRHPSSLSAVSWLLLGSAVTAFSSLLLGRSLPLLFLNLYRSTAASDATLFVTQFVISALLMLPATLCLGAMLPVATSTTSSGTGELGRRVSWLYTANLLGSAAGAVSASGLLLAHLGIDFSVRVASLAAIAAAIAIVAKAPRFSIAGATTAFAAILMILALDPGGERTLKSFGVYSEPSTYAELEPSDLRNVLESHQLLYYRDGPTATVAVQQVDRFLLLKINGKTDASNGLGDVQTQLLLGHLPLLVASADRVAVIGWGSGMTAGALLTHPVREVDAFEIEPAVIEASRYFDGLNGRPLRDARLNLVIGDARRELARRDTIYDLIVSEPSNPWLTGVSNLFTLEFFELAASRLRPGGILCQWFHLYGMSEESTRSLVATFQSVFPHVLAFKDRDLILLGSREPLSFALPRLEAAFADPQIRESLERGFIDHPFDILAMMRLDTSGARALAKGAPLNTDDNMLLELAAPTSLYRDRIDSIHAVLDRHPPAITDHVTGFDSEARVERELAASLFTEGRHDKALELCRRSLDKETTFEGQRLLGQILHGMGRTEEARVALERALTLGESDPQGQRFVRALLRSLDSTPQS